MTALVGLDFRGRRVVVVGGGTVATRRVRRFLGHGASLVVVSPEASDDIARLASHGDLEWRQRAIEHDDLDEAWLVVAATNDAQVNNQVAIWADAQQTWCINASDATAGSARLAAASTHGQIAVGVVSTADPDPLRIRGVRDAIASFIDEGNVDLRHRRPGGGRVILVGSGPGDPGLLTVRGRQALAEADVVISDRLGATAELSHLPYEVEVINVGKSPDNHPVPQPEINQMLVERALAGQTVVRLKGGDPYVFGRGGEEVHACLAADIPVEVVPGVTSALSVPALAGIPVTQRGVSASVLITSGHAGADPACLAAITSGATAVLLMAVAALPEICEAALAAGADPDLPVAIIESGSTDKERRTDGTLGTIAPLAVEAGVKPPAIIVVGKVAAPGLLASDVASSAP